MPRRMSVGGLLIVLGGLIGALSAVVLPWAKVSAQSVSETAKGSDGTDGWIALVFAAVLVIVGVVLLFGSGKRGLAVLAVIAGVLLAAFGVLELAIAKDSALDAIAEQLAAQFNVAVDAVRAQLESQVNVSLGIGLYGLLAGGLLGLVGGIVAVRETAAVPPPPPAPVGTPPPPPPPAPAG